MSKRPIWTIVGLAVGICGAILLATIESEKPLVIQQVIGNLLILIGGSSISAGIATSYAEDEADKSRTLEIANLGERLMSVAAEIRRAIIERETSEAPEETMTALIRQAERTLCGVVTSMNKMADPMGEVDYDQLVGTVEKTIGAVKRIGSLESNLPKAEVKELYSLENELVQLRSELKETFTNERIACIHCGSSNSVSIGEQAGSSSSTHCKGCGKLVFAHRKRNGMVHGSGEKKRKKVNKKKIDEELKQKNQIHIECANPDCNRRIPVVFNNSEGMTTRWCLTCAWKTKISLPDGEVLEAQADKPVEGIPKGIGIEGKLKIECPKCLKEKTTFARINNIYFAVCLEDDCLIINKPGSPTGTPQIEELATEELGEAKAIDES